MNKLLLVLLFWLAATPTFAQDGDELKPEQFTFRYYPEDSAEVIAQEDILAELSHQDIHHPYIPVYKKGMVVRMPYNKVYLLVQTEAGYWKISTEAVMSIMSDQEFLFKETLLDIDDRGKLLLVASYKHTRSYQYTWHSIDATDYSIIDVENEYRIYLGSSHYGEYDNSKGLPNGVEVEEGSEEYISRYHYLFELRVVPGKVIYENYIDSDNSDSQRPGVFATEYDFRNDTLYKGKSIPHFKNLAAPFGYKVLRGKVGSYVVTMHLTKRDKYYQGYYYYDKHKKPIGLTDNSLFDTSHADLVLREMMSDGSYFRGTVKDNTFYGKWSDGKKALDFKLKEDYSNGAVKLIASCFKDSVVDDKRNRYDLSYETYAIDTFSINKSLPDFGRTSFYEFRNEFYNINVVGLFDYHAEDVEFYTSNEVTESYNQNGLVSLTEHFEEYLGQPRIGHQFREWIYDAEQKRVINRYDVLNCPDSILNKIVMLAYKGQAYSESEPDEFYIVSMLVHYAGLEFRINARDFEESVLVSYDKLQQYIRPEYRKRLNVK